MHPNEQLIIQINYFFAKFQNQIVKLFIGLLWCDLVEQEFEKIINVSYIDLSSLSS